MFCWLSLLLLLLLLLKKLRRSFLFLLNLKFAHINVEHIVYLRLTRMIRNITILLLTQMVIEVLIFLRRGNITLRYYNLLSAILFNWVLAHCFHGRAVDMFEAVLVFHEVLVDVIEVGKFTKVFLWAWGRGRRRSGKISFEVEIITKNAWGVKVFRDRVAALSSVMGSLVDALGEASKRLYSSLMVYFRGHHVHSKVMGVHCFI